MHFAKLIVFLSIQMVFWQTSTSTSTSTASPSIGGGSSISLVQTEQISFYLQLISLVNKSCDEEDEKNPDVKIVCEHMTNATKTLRSFLAPLSEILPSRNQVKLLRLKASAKALDPKGETPSPKIYEKVLRALKKMRKLVPDAYAGDELVISLFAKEETGPEMLKWGSHLDLSVVMMTNILTQARFVRKEANEQIKMLKMLMLLGLVPQILVLLLMLYNYIITYACKNTLEPRKNT